MPALRRRAVDLRGELARLEVPTYDAESRARRGRPAPLKPSPVEQQYDDLTRKIQRTSMQLASLYRRDVAVEIGVPAGCCRFLWPGGRFYTHRGEVPENFIRERPYIAMVVNFDMAERLLTRDTKAAA